MKNKITLLIIASVLGLIALSVIQGYLVNNTYKLKKDSFIDRSIESTAKIDDNNAKMDAIYKIWYEDLLKLLKAYKLKELETEQILPLLRERSKILDDKYATVFKESILEDNIDHDLKFQRRISTFILYDSLGNDTILNGIENKKFFLLGDAFDLEKGYQIGRSNTHSDYSFTHEEDGKVVSKSVAFDLESENLMNIDDWEKNVWRGMKGLLITSILILLFVVGLLFYSIKTLITQKKIADVKTDFVNNITHEFKTPLATLSLATKMLQIKAKQKQSVEIAETVNVIERQGKRLQKLTDQVVNNALSFQEIELNKEEVIAADYLSSVFSDFELSVKYKEVSITKICSIEKQFVLLDKFHFTTALFNVLENAVEYNKGKIEIDIKVFVEDTFCITIADNGIGIPSKSKKLIFDKFYRVGNQEIHNVKGLGLGLYYAHQIVKAHGGELQVESELGAGTTFTIKMPNN